MTFRLTRSKKRDVQLIEVFDGDVLIAVIVPGDEPRQLRILSKYLPLPGVVHVNLASEVQTPLLDGAR